MKKDVFGILFAVLGIVIVILVLVSLNGHRVVAPGNQPLTSTGSIKDRDTTYTKEVSIDMSNSNSITITNTNNMNTIPSGLQIQDIKIGTGKAVKSGDTISVNYIGTLLNGTKFDSSYDRGQPFETQIGVGQVIKGWDEGMIGMKVGGKRKLVIPPELGYGATGAGTTIPPNSTLVFEVELMGIK
jgi:peptidylprolyl isomerase